MRGNHGRVMFAYGYFQAFVASVNQLNVLEKVLALATSLREGKQSFYMELKKKTYCPSGRRSVPKEGDQSWKKMSCSGGRLLSVEEDMLF
ncbi:hypothetical protein M0802_012617 [Mischocyttarus mexicanus]|nr:hypothetical protein M0802_012617 [Mischocyttarus mexicanus]